MRKASQRGKLPQRKCIFCEGRQLSRVSGEHLWPDWAKDYFERTAHDSRTEHRTTFMGKNLRPVGPAEVRKRHGHVVTSKIRVVCERCNNGWMSTIEDEAKPILQLLVEARFAALSPADLLKLATWTTLKFMVVDCREQEQSAITQSHRTDFYETRKLPDGLLAWIFRCGSQDFRSSFYQHSMSLARAPLPPILPRGKNTKSFTLGFGELFVYAIYARDASLYDSVKVTFSGGDIQIWPITKRGVLWPPPRALTNDEAWDICGTLRKVMMSPQIGYRAE